MSEFNDYISGMKRRQDTGATTTPLPAAPQVVESDVPKPGEYGDYLSKLKSQQDAEDATLNAFARAHKANPDEWAKMLKRGQAAGLSREVMEQFPAEAERRARIDEARQLARQSPATAQWLAQPDNAELAKDDTGALAATEKAISTLIRGMARGGLFGVALDRFDAPLFGYERMTGQAIRSGVNQMGRGAAGLGAAAGESLSEYATGPAMRAGALPEDVGARIGAFYREQAKAWEAKAKAEKKDWSGLPWLGRASLQGVESMPGSVGAAVVGVVTRNPELAAMFMSAPVGGQGYVDAREKNRGVGQSLTHGASQALIEYATEFLPAHRLLNDLGLQESFAKTLRNNLAREIPGEQAATVLQDLNDWATLNPEKPFADYIKARPGAFAETLVATIVATGGQISVAKLADEGLRGGQRQQDQMLMQSIGDAAAASKLRERMPEKFRELVDSITKDGPVENIRIPAQTFATYFQEAGIDPAAVALEVNARNFDEALAAGTDVIIPTGDYAAKIAGTDHHAALMPDIRLRDGDLTAREYEAYKADRAATDAQLAAEAQSGGETITPALKVIEDHFRSQLIALGRSPAVADAYAVAQARPIMRLAEEAGIDPMAIIEKYGLTVTSPLPDVLTKKGTTEAGIDAMFERLRAGDVPTDEEVYGQRITDFLRSKGGLRDTGGDLAGRDLDKNLKPFQMRLVRDDGLDFDAALTAARQAGYLPEAPADRPDETGINDLLEAIINDESSPVYSKHAIDDGMLQLRAALESLAKYLDNLGIDLTQITDNAQVRALMKQASETAQAVDDATVLAQMATEDGKPTPEQIAEAARQLADVRARYEGTKQWMKAPNGKPTKLNERQWLQVRTPMFKEWFGDWENDPAGASKVVDANGEPMVVYHASDADILAFDPSKLGTFTAQNTDTEAAQNLAKAGFWLNTSPLAGATVQGADYPVFVSIKSPRRYASVLGSMWRAAEARRNLIPQGNDGVIARDDEFGGTSFVALSPTQIKSATGNVGTFSGDTGNVLYQSETDDKRGYITIGKNRRISIALLEKADFSTLLHETGHGWLEIMGDLAESAGASEQLKADWATTLKFLGVENRAGIGVDQHEKWARANEAYLMEGNAPSPELRSVFQKFKSWLMLIYKQLEALNVKLTPEVRGVFDRLYATDAEIEAAKKESEQQALFLTAESAGMTDAEFALYREAIADGTANAKENLQARLMREQQRETEKWWKDARAAIKAEVTADTEAQPVYRAFAALSAGQMPDGTPMRLSREDLVRRYGEAWLKKLPRGFGYLYAKEGGVDAQTAAELLGFQDSDALVNALVDMRPKKALIEAETDARMRDTYGDLLHDAEAMRQAAVHAMHNDRQAEVLALELRALRKKRLDVAPFVRAERQAGKEALRDERAQHADVMMEERAKQRDEKQAARAVIDAIPPLSAFRDAAAGMIGQMQARDIRPGEYLRASQRANKEAFKAMANDDHQTAYEAKRRELLNHYLYREALAAREEIDKILDYARSFETKAKRERLGKAGGSYLDQIDALLERFEFKRVAQRTMDRRQSLREWAAERERDGLMVNAPDEILDDARVVNYREASVDTLRAVRDTLTNIEHLARLKNKLLKKRGELEWQGVKDELIGSLAANVNSLGDLGKVNRVGEGVKDKGARAWRRFDAAHLKVEQIVEWMDGGKIDGPWARYFFDLADDAQTREYDLHRDITQRLQTLAESMPVEWGRGLKERVPGFNLPGISPAASTRYTLISIALNVGNESNLEKMMRGHGWTKAQIDGALAQMTEADWRYVQGVWDVIETLWPEIAALEKRVSGIEPPRVTPREIQTQWGTMRGGYFPLVYDPKHSDAGEKQADATESVQDFMARGYGRAHTDKGHTKARLDTFAAPLRLDYEQVLTSHLSKVIKDISHREAVIGINHILKDREIKAELIDRLGEEKYTLLNEWLQTLVSDRADTLHQSLALHNAIFRALRTNTAIVTMGWKLSTMMSQFAGFGPSVDLVGYRNMTRGLVDFMAHPRDTLATVFEKSGEMRHRTNTLERDMKEQLLNIRGERGLLAATQRSAFYLTAMADRMVSVPTWLAGYRKALADGMSEDDAVRAGDRAVRLSQGSGGAKDLASVQRNSELMKLLTMYYTPFSVLYSRMRDVGHTTKAPRDLPRAVARSIALVILPAALGELLAGRGPDDDEDAVWWAARKSLLYPFASVPILRDLVSWQLEPALTEITGGTMHYAPRYQFSPILSAIQKIGGIPTKTLDVMTGDRKWDEVAWDVFEASGYVFGLPTAQPRITGEYLTDLMGGDANPDGIAEALHDLAFRRPRQ